MFKNGRPSFPRWASLSPRPVCCWNEENIVYCWKSKKKVAAISDLIAVRMEQIRVMWDPGERENENGKLREGALNGEVYTR